jgi:hypothetical protein
VGIQRVLERTCEPESRKTRKTIHLYIREGINGEQNTNREKQNKTARDVLYMSSGERMTYRAVYIPQNIRCEYQKKTYNNIH